MTVAEQSTPVPGIPCWVSLMTRDLRGTQDFYGTVLGWTFRSGTLGEGFTDPLRAVRAADRRGELRPR
ncbi:hypothetical protein ACFV0W_41380, partial [Streptomyces anulatus]